MEALAVSKATGVNAPKVRAAGTPSPGTSPKASGQPQASKPCKFFMGTSGCRRGPKCTFRHDMSGLPRQERSKKCLACGSEAHRLAGGGSPKGKGQPGGGNTNNAAGHRPTTADQASIAVQPGASPGRAEDFKAFMRMMFAAASSSEAFPPASTPATPAQPPAIEDKPAVQEEPKPSVKTIHLTAIEPGQFLEVDGMMVVLVFLALVDSRATHALRAASSEAEWASAQPVAVSLAWKGDFGQAFVHCSYSSVASHFQCPNHRAAGFCHPAAWVSFGLDRLAMPFDCSFGSCLSLEG